MYFLHTATESLSIQVLQAHQSLFADFSRWARADGLTPGWLHILMLVEAYPSLNQSQLAQATRVEPPTIVNKIDQLEKRGWLRRARSRTDRRTHTLFLTRQGQEILRQAKDNLDEHEKRLTKGLSKDEKAILLDLLRRIGTQRS